jgi:N-acetylneuraminic acid mutarotase
MVPSKWRFLLAVLSAIVAFFPGAGLGRVGDALVAVFPDQAARVLEAPFGFSRARNGFAARAPSDVRATLPRRGDGALRFTLDAGFEVRVREIGAAGSAVPSGHAVTYAREGGVSFWAANREGYEEWLLLDASAVRRDAAVAAWEVEGASLRQRASAIELCDTRGGSRITVTAPEAYARGGRAIAARLVARESRIELFVDAEGEPVLVDPAWERTRAMAHPRADQTATVLSDGRVLVIGGSTGDVETCPAMPAPEYLGSGCPTNTVEAYDPKTKTWTELAPMKTARTGHTATLVGGGDGRVLVAGGAASDGSLLATAELYDPKADTWTPGPDMNLPRAFHTATLLEDGRVFVASGSTNPLTEIFDPQLGNGGAWVTSGAASVPALYGRAATLLKDGRVMLTGGADPQENSIAEAYNPANGTWQVFEQMITPRYGHTATLIPSSGFVIVTGGGRNLDQRTAAELYNPNTGHWGPIASMNVARLGHTASVLANGTLFVSGGGVGPSEVYLDGAWHIDATMHTVRSGYTATPLAGGEILAVGGAGTPSLASAEAYDPTAHDWQGAHLMSGPRTEHTSTLLSDGRVLVVGGVWALNSGVLKTSELLASADVYDPRADAWSSTGPLWNARARHTATLLRDGTVLVTGGLEILGSSATNAETWAAGSWTSLRNQMNTPRQWHTATLLDDGTVVLAGGATDATTELYDPIERTFTLVGSMNTARKEAHAATLLGNGQVLVTGGAGLGDTFLDSAERYDPRSRTWSAARPMAMARGYHTATLLPDGRVMVAGGSSNDLVTTPSVEIYDPNSDRWSPGPPLQVARARHFAAVLDAGQVLVSGGLMEASAELLDPGIPSAGFELVASLQFPRVDASGVFLGGERFLVTGGYLPGNHVAGVITPVSADAEIFAQQPTGGACTLPLECPSGVCSSGVCCDGRCGDGCLSCSIADGAPEDGACVLLLDCHAYACDTTSKEPACLARCDSLADCSPGYACTTGHACEVPRDTRIDESCAVSREVRSPRPRAEPAILLLMAAGAGLYRRSSRRDRRLPGA